MLKIDFNNFVLIFYNLIKIIPKKYKFDMLDILINDYNTANGENSFHKTPLRWRRIMVESADSSKTYKECVNKIKNQIEEN